VSTVNPKTILEAWQERLEEENVLTWQRFGVIAILDGNSFRELSSRRGSAFPMLFLQAGPLQPQLTGTSGEALITLDLHVALVVQESGTSRAPLFEQLATLESLVRPFLQEQYPAELIGTLMAHRWKETSRPQLLSSREDQWPVGLQVVTLELHCRQ
jgi:hypothetical protein